MDISVVVTQRWIGYAVIVTLRHHSHTTCHTTSVSLSTYCDITMAATVTTILVKEVMSMQISLNSGFWRTTTCITVKILYYKTITSQLYNFFASLFPTMTLPYSVAHIPILHTYSRQKVYRG